MRKILLLLLWLGVVSVAMAQPTDSVCISGKVFGSKDMYLEGLVVTVLQPADSSVLTYTLTDMNGRYVLKFKPMSDEVLVRLAGVNVKREQRRVKCQTQNLDFQAKEESISLGEVQVKARKMWGNRDTLNYLVAAYLQSYDHTIGDVLKRLPGMSVEDGIIKYQGTPINKFYIENMDVLQGRYNIATDGIRADDVATVQVLENHEPVKALDDQVPPDAAAINIRLKEKARGVWTKSVDVGLGYDDANMWNADLNVMYFGKRRQHTVYYGTDNAGKGSGLSSRHYGSSGMGTTVLTDVLVPGTSPVGNSLRNNQHTVNVNNLNKLGETAQLNYNLSYGHSVLRKSSYQETAYFLPEGNVLVIAEDMSSRQTQNEADLQLSYENNAQKDYLRTSLSLVGKWKESNGLVSSTQERSGQHAFHRTLGAEFETRWVHRTSKGKGFELSGRNNLTTMPQALRVNMGMRQGVHITQFGSSNELSLINSLRYRLWTLSPTALFEVGYVGVEGALSTSDGENKEDMRYLTGKASVGWELRYVKNSLMATFGIPITVSYTNVIGKASVVKYCPSPSFNLLLRANDHWTLRCAGNYGINQKSWTQLIPFYIMGNYRTRSRYVQDLSYSRVASTYVKVDYKDIMSGIFANVYGRVSRSWDKTIYGMSVDENAAVTILTVKMPHHNDGLSLRGNVSKCFDWHSAKVELSPAYVFSRTKVLRQEVLQTSRDASYSFSGDVGADVVHGFRLGYNCRWMVTKIRMEGNAYSIRSFGQRLDIKTSLVKDCLMMGVFMNHTHNSGYSKKDYAFMDASLEFRTKKKVEFILEFSNIFNTKSFTMYSNDELTRYFTSYSLRPFGIFLKSRFIL